MNRALAASPIGLVAFALALSATAAAVSRGLVSDDAVTLWPSAIGAGGGDVPIGRIIASYPTLPFFVTTFLELVTPSDTPTPALLAAGLLALLAGIWFLAFRRAGWSLLAAGMATFLTALHPAMLAACLAGAAEMCLAGLLYLLGTALFDLRARTAAPEVMATGLALLGLSFSHPIGAAVAIAVLPAIVFAVRPTLVANSAVNVMLALVFPTVFAVGAFSYVSWVFPGTGWSFLAAPTVSLAGWSVEQARILGTPTGFPPLDAVVIVVMVLVLAAPIGPMAIGWMRGRAPLIAPIAVFASAIVVAGAISVATGLFGSPAPLAVAAPVLAAAIVARVPFPPERIRTVLALLAAGWLGGAFALALIEPRAAAQLRVALERNATDQARLDALALGGSVSPNDGVLIDTENTPAVVLGRGRTRGLVTPSDPDFTLALLFGRLETPFVAVPDPNSAAGVRDRINKSFPSLYRDGATGYRLIYRNSTWRLYARQQPTGK